MYSIIDDCVQRCCTEKLPFITFRVIFTSINSADLFIESMTLRLNNILIFLGCLCYTVNHVLKLQQNQVSATYICFKLYAVFILSLQK